MSSIILSGRRLTLGWLKSKAATEKYFSCSSVLSKDVNQLIGHSDAEPFAVDKKWVNLRYKRFQRIVKRAVEKPSIPEQYKKYDEEFAKVVDFDNHLNSLKTRGFLRPYKAYTPPEDLDERFMAVCSDVLGADFGKTKDLASHGLDRDQRQSLLSALSSEFGHSVPNSLLHTLTSLDHVLLFYSTRVDTSTPYDKLHSEGELGNLPPNLRVQLDPKRYDPEDEHPTFRTTAYPRTSTVMNSPEGKRKYRDVVAEKSPWRNAYSDDGDHY